MDATEHGPPPETAETRLRDWLVGHGLGPVDLGLIMPGLAERLRAEGVPVDRLLLGHTTLHPLYRSLDYYWEPGATRALQSQHDFATDGEFSGSPIQAALMSEAKEFRARLSESDCGYPVLAGLKAQGFTDYAIAAMPFEGFFVKPSSAERGLMPEQAGMALVAATKAAEGFTEAGIARIRAVARPLALLVRLSVQHEIARNITSCYVGTTAGERVLGGAIRLGDTAATDAVIWFSDLRGSTALAARMGRAEFTALINRVFAATAGAVEDAGGEVLGFLGDGALAIFPIADRGADSARRLAVHAAAEARARMEALNRERAAEGCARLDWGLALHRGIVEYGNIGTPNRHGWTVLGHAVNEAARIEALTASMAEPVLASGAFVDGLTPAWEPLGLAELRGAPEPVALFRPPPSTVLGAAGGGT